MEFTCDSFSDGYRVIKKKRDTLGEGNTADCAILAYIGESLSTWVFTQSWRRSRYLYETVQHTPSAIWGLKTVIKGNL